MSYSSEVLADSPVLYLRLGEASGTTADNLGSGGATYDGTYVDTPTLAQTGAVVGNTAVLLNGSSEYITVPDGAALDTGDTFTLECWIKRTATNVGQEKIFSGGDNSYYFEFNNDGLGIAQQAVAVIGYSTISITDTTTWHHVVWTKSGSTNKIYIDATDRTGTMTDSTISSPGTVYIGTKSSLTEYLNAAIDEVAIYSTALSSARVTAHYNARNDADIPVWTTPADTVSMSTTPELKFTSPSSTVAQHFQLQLDTSAAFNTGNLRTYDSSTTQTNWAYWNGSSWTSFTGTGLPSGYSGNEIRYTVTSALSNTTWYRRVRAGTSV